LAGEEFRRRWIAEATRIAETFYNPVRLHQTLGYLSPDQ